jgi:hypothetical protein
LAVFVGERGEVSGGPDVVWVGFGVGVGVRVGRGVGGGEVAEFLEQELGEGFGGGEGDWGGWGEDSQGGMVGDLFDEGGGL